MKFLKVILAGLARIVKKHSVIVKIYENKKHVRMSCKRTIGKEVGKSWYIDMKLIFLWCNGKVTDLQSAIIPAHSLEEANKKLQSEVKRRLGKCVVKIDHTSLLVSEDSRYTIGWNKERSLAISKAFLSFEFDGKRTITDLVYLPRQDWSENGHILNYNIYTCVDGFKYEKVSSGTWGNNKVELLTT